MTEREAKLYHGWEIHVPSWGDESLWDRYDDEASALDGLIQAGVRRDGTPRDAELREVYECRIGEWWIHAQRVRSATAPDAGAPGIDSGRSDGETAGEADGAAP